MARSKKARYGTRGRVWKDTVYASRCQAQARAKRKRRRAQLERARAAAELRRLASPTGEGGERG